METRLTCPSSTSAAGQSLLQITGTAQEQHLTFSMPCSRSDAEGLDGITSTPATSSLVVLSHTWLDYSRFYHILVPTVNKIFRTVYPKEKKNLYNLWATIFVEIKVLLWSITYSIFLSSRLVWAALKHNVKTQHLMNPCLARFTKVKEKSFSVEWEIIQSLSIT